MQKYWQARHQLTVEDELIVHGCRLLIPAMMRRSILKQLYQAHQGVRRTKERVRLSVYWPGIDNDVENMVVACKDCQNHLPSNCKEPLITKSRPSRRQTT